MKLKVKPAVEISGFLARAVGHLTRSPINRVALARCTLQAEKLDGEVI